MHQSSSSQARVGPVEGVSAIYLNKMQQPVFQSSSPMATTTLRATASTSTIPGHGHGRRMASTNVSCRTSSGSGASRSAGLGDIHSTEYRRSTSSSSSSSSASHTFWRPPSHHSNGTHTTSSRSNTHRASSNGAGGGSSKGAPSIPHLRAALHSLESQMATLLSEKWLLENRLEQAVRLQSPVHRLPSELLGSIFAISVLGLKEEDSVLLSTLMLVCKHWTEVATNTPVLWSRISISDHDSLSKAKMKLTRSKSVPLDLTLTFGPRIENSSEVMELVIHAMDILRPSIWRWRSFRLAVQSRSQAHAALLQCKQRAPLLEEFSVQVFQVIQNDSYSKPPLPLFENDTPRLRSSSFTSFNFNWDMTLVSKLRVLKLGGFWHSHSPSVATILNILRACPALEELSLRNMSDIEGACPEFSSFDEKGRQSPVHDYYSQFPKTSDMVSLPKLKRASFYCAGMVRISAVFSQLLFPALEQIEFAYMDNLTVILKHMKRQTFTSLPLRHLRIESCFFNELKLLRLLRRLPSLQTLELIDVEDASSNLLRVCPDWSLPL